MNKIKETLYLAAVDSVILAVVYLSFAVLDLTTGWYILGGIVSLCSVLSVGNAVSRYNLAKRVVSEEVVNK